MHHSCLTTTYCARNLGSMFDEDLTVTELHAGPNFATRLDPEKA